MLIFYCSSFKFLLWGCDGGRSVVADYNDDEDDDGKSSTLGHIVTTPGEHRFSLLASSTLADSCDV